MSLWVFIGIVNIEKLNWKSHIEHISCNISRTSGMLNRLKHYLLRHIKLALYYSLVISQIMFGMLAWLDNSQRILKLQKRSVRIILLSKYNAHTESIFKQLQLLKITDIYILNELKFDHKYTNNNLPHYHQ